VGKGSGHAHRQVRISRRGALKLAVLGAAAAAGASAQLVPSDVAGAVGRGTARSSHVALTQEAFASVVNSTFAVRVARSWRSVVLSSVDPLASGPNGFSLSFDGLSGQAFGQDTYKIVHPDIGRFPMFMVPVGLPGAEQQYQAIFNFA